jgi:hypothetical protein
MYIFDKNVFISMGVYYPNRFPTIWRKIGELAEDGTLRSVREVRREIEGNCQFTHILDWVANHHYIFMMPTDEEMGIVADIFQNEQYRGLVRRNNILRGLPVADPFIVAAGQYYVGCVVTQESLRQGGARIPTLCREKQIECINLEGFLEREGLIY